MYVLPNNLIFKKLGNFKKISEMFGFDGEVYGCPPKSQALTIFSKKSQKIFCI